MTERHRHVVGILGGMGPAATIWLMQRIMDLTPATDDSDHIPLLVDNNTQVPSRINAIIDGNGENPAPVLEAMARKLEAGGAKALAMPCNTAHMYAASIRHSVSIPLLDMIDLTAGHVASMPASQPVRRVGMLASPAVRLTGVFDRPLQELGIAPLYPRDDTDVLDCIRQIKAGRNDRTTLDRLDAAIKALAGEGAELIVIACSELSILAQQLGDTLPKIDSIDILARAVVGFSMAGRFTAGGKSDQQLPESQITSNRVNIT